MKEFIGYKAVAGQIALVHGTHNISDCHGGEDICTADSGFDCFCGMWSGRKPVSVYCIVEPQ